MTWPAFVLDAGTFLVSAIIVYRRRPNVGRAAAEAGRAREARGGAVVEGLRVVAGSRVLWTTLLALAISMFGLGAVNVLFLPLVVEVLEVSPVWLGAIELAQSVSMILAAGIVGRARRLASARRRSSPSASSAPASSSALTGAVDRGVAGRPAAVRHRLVHHARSRRRS